MMRSYQQFFVSVCCIVLLASCAKYSPDTDEHTNHHPAFGSFYQFDGRLLMLQPNKRWQVQIHWQGTPEQGIVRLTHAASGRIIQLKWHNQSMWILDNQETSSKTSPRPAFRPIHADELQRHGLILSPQTLASILQGHIPNSLKRKKTNLWQGRLQEHLFRLLWQADNHKLTITDMTHGSTAILIINPTSQP